MGYSHVDDDVVSSLQHTWQHASSPTLGTAEMGMETDTATIRGADLPELHVWDTYMQLPSILVSVLYKNIPLLLLLCIYKVNRLP